MSGDLLKRARACERDGKLDEAAAAYRDVLAKDGASGEAAIRLVALHLLAGRNADAETEARAFVARTGSADAHSTLGQVLRLTSRADEAIASFRRAVELRPKDAPFRVLLNEGLRAQYWRPDASKLAGASGPLLLHLRFLGLLSPEVQHWLATETDERLPASLVSSLDARYGGRFSKEVDALAALADSLRGSGPVAAARARVVTSSATLEGTFIDTDSTILGSLEAVEGEVYSLIPFASLKSMEIRSRGPWFGVRLGFRDGTERDVSIPALYLFTDGSRNPRLREGSLTVWKAFRDRFRIGLGLRDYFLDAGGKPKLVGFDDLRRVDFL